jgi:DNA replication and repair protein RecF
VAGGPVDAEALRAALREGRRRDRAAGRTLTGPHRDDLSVMLAAKQAPAADCSTGEQKAMLISIVLAHAALTKGPRPQVLLLDEIAAHLDPVRRAALYERLGEAGAQVWMTGTELAPFEPMGPDAAVWRVADGAAVRV